MSSRHALFAAAILTVLTFLSACGRRPVVTFPTGPQTVTGVLEPVPLSITRRGTHILTQDGKDLCYVESTVITLSSEEGKPVTLQGTFSSNIDPTDLPVLTVTSIEDGQDRSRGVFLSALHLRLSVPEHWTMVKHADGSASFTASGSQKPILTVAPSALTMLPAGSPVVVDGQRGSRVIPGGSTDQVVYILRSGVPGTMPPSIITFTFTPLSTDLLAAPAEFQRILKSVQFDERARASGSMTGSGVLHGQPCGGVAGILCPEGFYCNITDATINAGVCAAVGR